MICSLAIQAFFGVVHHARSPDYRSLVSAGDVDAPVVFAQVFSEAVFASRPVPAESGEVEGGEAVVAECLRWIGYVFDTSP